MEPRLNGKERTFALNKLKRNKRIKKQVNKELSPKPLMPNLSSTSSEQLKNANKLIHSMLQNNNYNIEKNLNKISKLEV